ncbi:MAG: lactoylglutathione lyase [Saprospirales bacterium]|nr:lactoylglutathione lyase [Saprospirales bacterium]
MQQIISVEIILYVSDQEKSMQFYEKLFRVSPDLHVPGMTEFRLSENCKLGLMPNNGIAKILSDKTPHPTTGNGIPRCELYFNVDDVEYEFQHALNIGATLISEIEVRSWNERVCYFADNDGHIIAFAEKIND